MACWLRPPLHFGGPSPDSVADPDAVCALNYLIAETGACLVITSTWRLEYSLGELTELLRSWRVQAEILGVSPSGVSRGEEIQDWLDGFSGMSGGCVRDPG